MKASIRKTSIRKTSIRKKLVLLPGDGVGPEVLEQARRVLEAAIEGTLTEVCFETAPIGGCAIDATGEPLPSSTLELCRDADAILLGAVGGPQWSDPSRSVRPEQGLLKLRAELGLFANLRPVPVFEALAGAAPLRPDLLRGVDLLFVRELTGGIYFGPRQEADPPEIDMKTNRVAGRATDTDRAAFDTMLYRESEIERVAHVAFRAARQRRRRVTSVDKANVLASMRLWRSVVDRVALEYPDVELEHQLVDACAMHLLRRPADFDVVLAGNLFGDILSDEAATLAGSLGLLPSASLRGDHLGLYEPIHGSAPDIAGQGIANPIGAILSAAMLLRHSLSLEAEANRVESAVAEVLDKGARTADLAEDGAALRTSEVGDRVVETLRALHAVAA